MDSAVRRELEEKEAFHNIVVAVPFFISHLPTPILALPPHLPHPAVPHQLKIYFNGLRFVPTRILYFPALHQATLFHAQTLSRPHTQGEP